MQRFRLVISYKGTRYHGWQTQYPSATWKGEPPLEGEGIPTVQQEIERALGSVLGHPTEVVGSSRTDAGVHAKGQVGHFDTPITRIPLEGLRRAVNARLPQDILIRSIEPVSSTFDAIKSTASKRYQYVIWNSADRPPFFAELAWHRWQSLDLDAIRRAAAEFEGEHDFNAFARPGHGRENTVRTVYQCGVSIRLPRIVVGVEGSGFLWNQVRIMVGTLMHVGLGRLSAQDIREALQSRDRARAGPTAPAHGLYLQWIRFKPESEWVQVDRGNGGAFQPQD
jgi:tRNA pseudouridine38-40 synthase